MLDDCRALSEQFERGRAFAGDTGKALVGIRSVVVCGMGGSAFPGDFLKMYAEPKGVAVEVSRDYVVRARILGPEQLVIVSSFSGNTEETIASLEDAVSRGANVVTVSAGGALAAIAAERDLPHVRIEKPHPTFQPRVAMGYFFGAFAGILENAGLLSGVDADLAGVAARLRGQTELESQAKRLAGELHGRIPVIYATAPFDTTAARVIKIKLNENAKTAAFFYGLPELNHNEMVGYTRLCGPFTAVLLRDPDQSPRMKRREDVTVETLRENGVPVVEIPLLDGNAIEKLFAVLSLFDFVSCFLAMADGIDPNPGAMVEDFKQRQG